ncbi:unnamed protein product [Lactuca virosa]|uniref:Uncharacterized protein n=1 Tax=Lactuca virosa TaxID=75947 RepID=A0AAU9LVA3_9ASTR|nr:unnamed protein product [Lactuca virosa]
MGAPGRPFFDFSLPGLAVAFGEPLALLPPSGLLVTRETLVVFLSSSLAVVLSGKTPLVCLSSGSAVAVFGKPPAEHLSPDLSMIVERESVWHCGFPRWCQNACCSHGSRRRLSSTSRLLLSSRWYDNYC